MTSFDEIINGLKSGNSIIGTESSTTGNSSTTTGNSSTTTGNSWWQSLFSNTGGILTGVSNIISSVKGNAAPETVVYSTQQKSNTGLYIGIGAAALVIIIIISMTFSKR